MDRSTYEVRLANWKSIIEQFWSSDCKAFFLQIEHLFHSQPINCHETDF